MTSAGSSLLGSPRSEVTVGSRHVWGVPPAEKTERNHEQASLTAFTKLVHGISLARRGAGRLHHPPTHRPGLQRPFLGVKTLPQGGVGEVGTGCILALSGEALLPAQGVHKFQRSYQTS